MCSKHSFGGLNSTRNKKEQVNFHIFTDCFADPNNFPDLESDPNLAGCLSKQRYNFFAKPSQKWIRIQITHALDRPHRLTMCSLYCTIGCTLYGMACLCLFLHILVGIVPKNRGNVCTRIQVADPDPLR